ncbi:MAG: glycosyltransferase family 2 protein [Candidatus Omnitrophota bacterium]|nr:glycosyltransferase family 2 protein [Candidatus Omnitrophota bacterium]
MQKISLIMLVYNEAEVIEKVIKEYYEKVISKIPGSEFIIAEDGSSDGTKEILHTITSHIPIQLIQSDIKKGYTKAMRDAFKLAQNEVIFFSDSDGQHDPEDFWKLYSKIEQNYDMVIGVKQGRVKNDGLFRFIISRILNSVIIPLLFKVKFKDLNCGFRLIKKRLIEDIMQENWLLSSCIAVELTIRAVHKGYRIAEVPISHFPREAGNSRSFPLKKIPSVIFNIIKNFLQIKKEFRYLDKAMK